MVDTPKQTEQYRQFANRMLSLGFSVRLDVLEGPETHENHNNCWHLVVSHIQNPTCKVKLPLPDGPVCKDQLYWYFREFATVLDYSTLLEIKVDESVNWSIKGFWATFTWGTLAIIVALVLAVNPMKVEINLDQIKRSCVQIIQSSTIDVGG